MSEDDVRAKKGDIDGRVDACTAAINDLLTAKQADLLKPGS